MMFYNKQQQNNPMKRNHNRIGITFERNQAGKREKCAVKRDCFAADVYKYIY